MLVLNTTSPVVSLKRNSVTSNTDYNIATRFTVRFTISSFVTRFTVTMIALTGMKYFIVTDCNPLSSQQPGNRRVVHEARSRELPTPVSAFFQSKQMEK